MNATATATRNPEMLEKIEKGQGFIAALDQSGGSTPGALKAYGIGEGAFSNDEEMFRLVHQMRSRIITAPSFGNGKVLAPGDARVEIERLTVSACDRLECRSFAPRPLASSIAPRGMAGRSMNE